MFFTCYRWGAESQEDCHTKMVIITGDCISMNAFQTCLICFFLKTLDLPPQVVEVLFIHHMSVGWLLQRHLTRYCKHGFMLTYRKYLHLHVGGPLVLWRTTLSQFSGQYSGRVLKQLNLRGSYIRITITYVDNNNKGANRSEAIDRNEVENHYLTMYLFPILCEWIINKMLNLNFCEEGASRSGPIHFLFTSDPWLIEIFRCPKFEKSRWLVLKVKRCTGWDEKL